MIAWIKGTIIHKGGAYLIVENNSIGYKIFVSPSILFSKNQQDQIELWIHEQQREDGRELFGFMSVKELEMFWKLITVSGVGPKSALTILGSASFGTVSKWIEDGDAVALSSVHGIGKKTAQKIVLELKGKLTEVGSENDEALQALVGLGYSKEEARGALDGLGNLAIEEKIRTALKSLAKR